MVSSSQFKFNVDWLGTLKLLSSCFALGYESSRLKAVRAGNQAIPLAEKLSFMGSRTKYKTKSFVVIPPERLIASKDVTPVVSRLAKGKWLSRPWYGEGPGQRLFGNESV